MDAVVINVFIQHIWSHAGSAMRVNGKISYMKGYYHLINYSFERKVCHHC